MFVFDILIYGLFAFYSSWLARKSQNYIDDNNLPDEKWDKYLIFFVLFFSVIGGIRWRVGSDNLSYAHWFANSTGFEIDKEYIWWWFVNLIRGSGLHWIIGLGFCAFFQIFFITKTLQPYRWLLVFMPFVLFGGRYWMDCMGAVRQMIVACGFLWASNFICRKKLVWYLLFVACAVQVHQSALLLLPFYLLPNKLNITNRRLILIGILLVCLVLGQTPAFQGAVKYVEYITNATDYQVYEGIMTNMLMKGKTDESLSFGPMMLSYLLIPIFIIWYGPLIKERYGKFVPQFDLWYNLAYFYACGYFLVCNISHLFIRPMMYFSLFQMLMATMLLRLLWTEYRHYAARSMATILFCAVIATNTAWDVIKASPYKYETTTYKVSLLHKDQWESFGL